jgi:hypothetical protein
MSLSGTVAARADVASKRLSKRMAIRPSALVNPLVGFKSSLLETKCDR